MKLSWNDFYLGIAEAASRRSSCERSKVGAVVVTHHNRVAAIGYNDAPPKHPGCEACPRRLSGVAPGSSYDAGTGACVALHAEQNAVLYSSPEQRAGGTLYVTRSPCDGCLRMIQGSGLARVVHTDGILDL